MTTKGILLEIFKETANGELFLDTNQDNSWKFNIHFYSKINGISNAKNTDAPELQIQDLDQLATQIDQYLKLAEPFYVADQDYFDLTDLSFKKKLIADLFVSATNYDFQNFSDYLSTRTAQLSSNVDEDYFDLGSLNGAYINAKISKNHSNLEGPFNFELSADVIGATYPLPSITFGVAGDKVYIYAIKNFNEKIFDPKTQKYVDTLKNGKPVLYTKFHEDMDAYFHTITQKSHTKGVERNVSPNALVSLALFMSFLKTSNAKEIIAPDFMPVRYMANRTSIENKYFGQGELLEEKLEKHDNDQNNITNKFMYLFLRYNSHFPECEIYYDDLKQEMHMSIEPTKSKGENLIYQIDQVLTQPDEVLDKEKTIE